MIWDVGALSLLIAVVHFSCLRFVIPCSFTCPCMFGPVLEWYSSVCGGWVCMCLMLGWSATLGLHCNLTPVAFARIELTPGQLK